MFSNGFPKEWSTLRKLAWLYRTVINAVVSVLKTIIGNPIHITDALAKPVQALSVAIEPIQDLHGYDKPWPAGGGVNIFDFSTFQNKSIGGDGGIFDSTTRLLSGIFTVQANSTYVVTYPSSGFIFIGHIEYDDSDVFQSRVLVDQKSGSTQITPTTNRIRLYFSKDPNTGTISKNDLATAQVTKGTTPPDRFYSYSNICPISGWTGANVTRTGKNLLNKANVLQNMFIGTSQKKIKPIGATGACVYCAIKGGEKYTVSKMASARFMIATTTELPALNVAINNYVGDNTAISLTIQTTEDDNYIVAFVFLESADAGKSQQEILDTVQCELGSTASSYEPYTAETYTITFPTSAGTVYGGTLDVTNGKLTVDRAMVDMGTLNWSRQSASGHERLQNTEMTGIIKGSVNNATKANILCSIYATITANGTYNHDEGIGIAVSQASVIFVYDNNYTDAASFKAAMSGVQLVYELATPIVYDLTPTEITTLLGTNNLWSDGTMTLVYLADGNASDEEALNILLGNRYANNHGEDEPTDREALDILLGGTR